MQRPLIAPRDGFSRKGQQQKYLTPNAAPVLDMGGDGDTLHVLFGGLAFEVIEAGEAALALAQETGRIWLEAVNAYGAAQNPSRCIRPASAL